MISHFNSFSAVVGPTPGTLTLSVKLGISCIGLDWKARWTCDSVTGAISVPLDIGKTFLFLCGCDACYTRNSLYSIRFNKNET